MGLFDRLRSQEPKLLATPRELAVSYRTLADLDADGTALEEMLKERGPGALAKSGPVRRQQLEELRQEDASLGVISSRDFGGLSSSARALPLLRVLQDQLDVSYLVRDAGPGIGQVISRLAFEKLDALQLTWAQVAADHPQEVATALGIRDVDQDDLLAAVYERRVENAVRDIQAELAVREQEALGRPALGSLELASAPTSAAESPTHSL